MAQRGLLCPTHTTPLRHSGTSVTLLTSLLVMNVMETSSLTVVVATLGPGGSNSELPNFFQFWVPRKQCREVRKRQEDPTVGTPGRQSSRGP